MTSLQHHRHHHQPHQPHHTCALLTSIAREEMGCASRTGHASAKQDGPDLCVGRFISSTMRLSGKCGCKSPGSFNATVSNPKSCCVSSRTKRIQFVLGVTGTIWKWFLAKNPYGRIDFPAACDSHFATPFIYHRYLAPPVWISNCLEHISPNGVHPSIAILSATPDTLRSPIYISEHIFCSSNFGSFRRGHLFFILSMFVMSSGERDTLR